MFLDIPQYLLHILRVYTGWTFLQLSTFFSFLQSYHSKYYTSNSKLYKPLVLLQIFPQPRCVYAFNDIADILPCNFGKQLTRWPKSVRETPHFNGKLYKNMSYCSSRAAKAARLTMISIKKKYWNQSKKDFGNVLYIVYWKMKTHG